MRYVSGGQNEAEIGDCFGMNYEHIVEGCFQERPNRFIALVEIEGQIEKVHVKNTGRCRELLKKGERVYLNRSDSAGRSTAYDLIAVQKGKRLINMDSQAPNKAVLEWLQSGRLFPDTVLIRPETNYGNSRFDFYIETETDKIFMEVKGVTLEENGVVRFPDAPSDRAVKHLEELIAAKQEGIQAFVMFVIQMENVEYFTANCDTHPEFAQALQKAAKAGVQILAYDCEVTPQSMTVNHPVPVLLRQELGNISLPLLKWYDRNKRILPWREFPSPYRVWVSEIMLQQTRVEAVKPYFDRFMKALPDIGALAAAEEEELLKLWEGLGYYNRVRNLQKAARKIMQEYGGKMPGDYEDLMKLPGIGSYTAGAVASIAFGQKVPAVDGNVLRVAARLRGDERLITEEKVKQTVWQDFREMMPSDRSGDFNQAMMEIGACVCIPNGAPLCGKCPVAEECMAYAMGKEQNYPRKMRKKPRQIQEKTVLLLKEKGRVVICKRENRGLLAGMYEPPTLEGFCTAEKVADYLAEQGYNIVHMQPLTDAKHVFTHIEWHMKAYLVQVEEQNPRQPSDIKSAGESGGWLLVEADDTNKKYPIPSAFAAYAEYLGIV